jgi:integrase/recombinase XerD
MPRKSKPPRGTYWRKKVLWAYYQVEGKRYRHSLETDDPKLAKERRDEARKQVVAEIKLQSSRQDRVRFKDILISWDRHMRGEVSEKTVKRYLSSLEQIEEHLEGLYLDEINGKVIGQIIEDRKLDEVTNATIRRDLTALSSVIDYAILVGKLETANPVILKMKYLNERRDPIVLPSDDQINRVIQRAPGMIADIIKAAWLTGCRLNELVEAKRTQIDHDRKQLTIIKAKRGKLRVIDLAVDGAYQIFRNLPTALHKPYIFWHDDGEPYQNMSSRFRALCVSIAEKDKSFSPFRFHDLRPPTCRRLVEKGAINI